MNPKQLLQAIFRLLTELDARFLHAQKFKTGVMKLYEVGSTKVLIFEPGGKNDVPIVFTPVAINSPEDVLQALRKQVADKSVAQVG